MEKTTKMHWTPMGIVPTDDDDDDDDEDDDDDRVGMI